MHFFSSIYFLLGLVVGVTNPWVIDSLAVVRPCGWCPVTAGRCDKYLRERGSTEPQKQISCSDPREQLGSLGNADFLGQPIYLCKWHLHKAGAPFREPFMSYTEKWEPSPSHCYWTEGKSCTSNMHRNLFFLTFTLCGSAWVGHVWFNPNYFFFLYFKSQMLKQFTLIKLQLALKLSCINFSSIYREQDRWFKLHAIWGNARDICYRVNCLKLRFLSPFWVKDICSRAYWIRWKGFLLKWSMYRFLLLLLFGGAPLCCCRCVHFCELQIAMCRSVMSFAELAPNVLLGKGCE